MANSCDFVSQRTYKLQEGTDVNGYAYRYVSGDPMGTRLYTLANGLRVYLSRYTATPNIYTNFVINAGGQDDPSHATGLAHYLEHIMFKGTSQFGTQDWNKEKPLLDTIEVLFERYRQTKDQKTRTAIYQRIDKLSYEASKYAVPNEYDKMVASIGATGTNAYTSYDRTVYINKVPSNQLEKWLRLEANRFSEVIARLFHTELEAVYEEKNGGMDNDDWVIMEATFAALFPTHPYGTQSIIGTIEHLKNPSIAEIKKFF